MEAYTFIGPTTAPIKGGLVEYGLRTCPSPIFIANREDSIIRVLEASLTGDKLYCELKKGKKTKVLERQIGILTRYGADAEISPDMCDLSEKNLETLAIAVYRGLFAPSITDRKRVGPKNSPYAKILQELREIRELKLKYMRKS